MKELREKTGFIIDMDGVLYHGNRLLEGAKEFVDALRKYNKRFLFLTNSSERSRRELSQKLARMGIEVEDQYFYTSALATAAFLQSKSPGDRCLLSGRRG
jgi:NagD protein